MFLMIAMVLMFSLALLRHLHVHRPWRVGRVCVLMAALLMVGGAWAEPVRLPEKLKAIGAEAFEGCTGLSGELEVSRKVALGKDAFADCPALRVTLPLARVAVIGDEAEPAPGTLNDDTHQAVSKWCASHHLDYQYFCGNPDAAVAAGFDTLFVVGFGTDVSELQKTHPEIRIICLDTETEKPGNNVYSVAYRSDQAGFLAGYAAVRLGYRRLGFLGGMEIPAVVDFGEGFVHGANQAAIELGVTQEVSVDYTYSGGFRPDDNVERTARNWYDSGVEVIFCCGGSQCESVVIAAREKNGKIIGVDTDQHGLLEGSVVTSAMKGLGVTATDALDHIAQGTWNTLGGRNVTLGLEADDPENNYVQLAPNTQFGKGFTKSDYAALVKALRKGDYSTEGAVKISVRKE